MGGFVAETLRRGAGFTWNVFARPGGSRFGADEREPLRPLLARRLLDVRPPVISENGRVYGYPVRPTRLVAGVACIGSEEPPASSPSETRVFLMFGNGTRFVAWGKRLPGEAEIERCPAFSEEIQDRVRPV